MKASNIIWFVCVIAFSLAACSNEATSQVFEEPSVQHRVASDVTHCRFNTKLPNDFSLFAAGAYAGRKLGFQIDSSGRQATQMDVVVNHTPKPVVLMLGAYEPTIWDISWTPNTEIVAVMVSGYHTQVISGLTDATEVLISTEYKKGKCGIFFVDRERLGSLNPIARRLFNHEVDMVYLAEHGQVLIGDALLENEELTQSPLIKPEDYRKVELSGTLALEQAVSRGELRKATLDDACAWVDIISKEKPLKDIPPVAGQGVVKHKRPLLRNAYVVLKPFTYPDGLRGRNAAVFFIPKGVPIPNGKPGGSTIYDFNTLSCAGRLCDR